MSLEREEYISPNFKAIFWSMPLSTAANWNVIRAGKLWLSNHSLKHSFEVRAQNACYSPEAHMHTRHYRQGVKEREEDC